MTPPPPILVIGGVRSGTTWVGRTLCQAPGLRYAHEPFNKSFPLAGFGFTMPHWLHDAEHGAHTRQIEDAFRRLLRAGPLARAWRDATTPLNALTPLRWFKHARRHLRVPERILVKDPLALLSAEWLQRTFAFQVVCTIRRAHSFVASMKQMGWTFDAREITSQPGLIRRCFPELEAELAAAGEHPGDLVDQATLLWRLTHLRILDLLRDHPDWCFVKQEDLALRPVEGFRSLFATLGLPFTADTADYVLRHTQSAEPGSAAAPATHQYRARAARQTLSAWETILTDGEAARVSSATRELESRLYPSAGTADPSPDSPA